MKNLKAKHLLYKAGNVNGKREGIIYENQQNKVNSILWDDSLVS